MKHILILCFTRLQHDARVSRQIDFLKKNYRVTAVAFDGPDDAGIELVRIQKPSLTFFRKSFLAVLLIFRLHRIAHSLLHGQPQLKKLFSGRRFDLIIANDVETLPIAFDIDPGARVLFDAHEYAPRHFEDKLSWRLFFQPLNQFLCKKYIPRVRGMMTVGKGLAREYQKYFHVEPVILTNATWYRKLNPSPVAPGKIRMIHHGGATVSRNLELMIEVMKHLDERFTLDLMLIIPDIASATTRNYIHKLRSLATGDSRIQFLPPVKSDEIVSVINRYDLGIFLLPPINFNYANTLPNKLFDFIQARLGIAIGPTPEMAEIVKEYGNGIVSADFSPESLAAGLNALTLEDIERFKSNSGRAARELTAEKNKAMLLELVEKLMH